VAIQHVAGKRFEQQAAILQRQQRLLGQSTETQRRLSEQIVFAEQTAALQKSDLERLRREVQSLKAETNAVASSPAALVLSPPMLDEDLTNRMRLCGWARDLSSACMHYAAEHTNQFPSDFAQIQEMMARHDILPEATNEFDLVFTGNTDDLSNVPRRAVAVVRSKKCWKAETGGLARAYGMACGVGHIIESDDYFQTWEAEHIVPAH